MRTPARTALAAVAGLVACALFASCGADAGLQATGRVVADTVSVQAPVIVPVSVNPDAGFPVAQQAAALPSAASVPVRVVWALPLGSAVADGDVLVRLDDTALAANESAADADVRLATAQVAVLDDKLATFRDKQKELREKRAEVNDAIATLTDRRAEVVAALATLRSKRAELRTTRATVAAKRNQVAGVVATLTAKRREVTSAITKLTTTRAQLTSARTALTSKRATLVTQLADAKAALAQIESLPEGTTLPPGTPTADELRAAIAKINAGIATIDTKLAQVKAGLTKINAALPKATAGLNKIDAGLAKAGPGLTKLNAALAKIDAGLAKINAGISKASTGLEKIDEGLTKARTARTKIKNGLTKLADASRKVTDARRLARVSIDAAQVRLTRAREQRARAIITAPAAGTVTRIVRPGDVLAAGATLVVLATQEPATITAWVAPDEAARLCVGDAATVSADGLAARHGRISVIGVRADYAPSYQFTQDAEQTRAVPVTIALNDQLPGGLPVDLDLVPCRTTQ